MKKALKVPILFAITALLFACNQKHLAGGHKEFTNNPFAKASALTLQAPAFDKIKDEDFKPAIEEGIRQQQEEIEKISNNTAAPDFENTLVALEKTGSMLQRVNNVFSLLAGANTNPVLQQVQEDEAAKLAANDDAIYLNSKLFQRIISVDAQKEKYKLDPESLRLLQYYKLKFELAGANLSESEKNSIKQLNKEEAELAAKFTNQLLAATKAAAVVITNKAELDGLSAGTIDAAEKKDSNNKSTGKWVLSLQNTTQQPNLQQLSNRATRQKLFEASWTRTERSDSNDTRKVIERLAQIRAQQAKILHFKNYAEWKLQDQMAKSPATVQKFFEQLIPAATAKATREAKDIQDLIDAQNGGFTFAPWDWNFYAEQVRKAKFNLDDNEVKPYFELNTVLTKGVFYAANLLYGLTFNERHDLPVYQADVRVFDVIDKDGSQLGLFYCDYFKRDNKSGGAWMSNIVGQSKLFGTKPVIYNVCNFTKPVAGQPALISHSDVITMFHEFGHGLHGLFADQQYPSLSGANTARDFVEFPSQFNENWAFDPTVFNHYAVHYKTGAPMPKELLEKINKASTFNQGYSMTEILAAAQLDLQWYTLQADAPLQDVDKFELQALKSTGLNLAQVPPRYRSSYFLHIWSNGYAAGYYAYVWTEMLAHDAFAWFQKNGGLTRANGQRYRDMILSRGNTLNYGTMFKNFTGHDPEIQPMLIKRGLQ